ncbi:YicC/YloC family endoribonuclease [uncultured Ruthenibacterium sp.]|uniref:YicC/YloC family endoribonuclease n=1 Tax=uncultured Ruthenibacterium sp. TaxID=1905347 RepID=UPI00349E8CE6
MILSMTGYGRAEEVIHGRDITVEIKSVNSRFFEYSSRMPRSYTFLDDRLKKLLSARISRGKVELGLTVQNLETVDTEIVPNVELARQYVNAVDSLCKELAVPNDLKASSLMRIPEIFTTQKAKQDEEQIWLDVQHVAEQALSSFVEMRSVEGNKLRLDVLSRLDFLEQTVEKIVQTSEGRVSRYTEKLYAKLQALLEDRNIDEARLLTEAAIFADKTAVDEETVRLQSHIAQYRNFLNMDSPIGKKLDFLTQELNRETNTIGSKCSELEITRMVVEMKGEIEKIREQIQNIE